MSFEERESMSDDYSASDFLEMDRKGFEELAQCGITAHDFSARNLCALNVEFLTLCGDSEMQVEAAAANDDE